jgi:SGNH domain-containing protein
MGLAWATKVWVEDPTQRWQRFARPAATAAFVVVAMLAASGVAALQLHVVQQRNDAARTALAASEDNPCFGAASLAPDAPRCTDVFGPAASLSLTPEDRPWFQDSSCVPSTSPMPMTTCVFSKEPPTRTVALIGDSHAEHWRGALHRVARELNWRVVELFRGGCPATDARVLQFDGEPTDTDGCHSWGQQVADYLAQARPDYVFTSSWAAAETFDGSGSSSAREAGVQGFVDTWTRWVGDGATVFVFRDIPGTGGQYMPECLEAHPGAPVVCSRPRAEVLHPDALTEAAARVHTDRIRLIDMSDFFCDDTTCYSVIGGAIVYWDGDHMSAQFSRTLAPYLLDRMGGGYS